MLREGGASEAPFFTVIASGAKQSRIFPRRQSGLLRSARNDGAISEAIALQFTFQTADTPSPSRGMLCPRFPVRFAPLSRKGRREGRAPASTRRSVRDRNAHGLDLRSPDLPAFPARWF